MKFVPVLYGADETDFSTNGLGRLTELSSCTVNQSLNEDEYELEASCPVDARLYDKIAIDEIILAYPGKDRYALTGEVEVRPQPFRIYSTSKDLQSGIITINATHAALHMMHLMVTCPGSVSGTAVEVWNALKANAMTSGTEWPFTFHSYLSDEASIDFETPVTLYDAFYDEENGILKNFNARIVFDKYNITLESLPTEYSGTTIRQGNNMTSLTVVSDASDVVTGIVPYYSVENDDGTTTTVYADPPVVELESSEVAFDHLLPVDCTSDIEKPEWAGDEWTPDPDDLTEWAEEYLSANYTGNVPTTYASGLVTASDTISGDICLGDIVAVISKTLQTRVKSRVSGTVYNCLTDMYESISIGTTRTNLAQTLVDMTNTEQKTEKVNLTARHGESGEFTWITNHAGNLVDVVVRHSIVGVSCSTSSGGKYQTSAITISVPDVCQTIMAWTLEESEGSFLSDTDISSTLKFTKASTKITVYVVSEKKCTVTGTIYIHFRLNSGKLTDTNYVTPTTYSAGVKSYWYADCAKKVKKFQVKAGKEYYSFGDCSAMYASVYNMGTYYKAGFSAYGDNTTDISELPAGISTGLWTAAAATKLYLESKRKTCIGTIPAGTQCRCLAILSNSFLLLWPVAGQTYHRIGFTNQSGGLLDS